MRVRVPRKDVYRMIPIPLKETICRIILKMFKAICHIWICKCYADPRCSHKESICNIRRTHRCNRDIGFFTLLHDPIDRRIYIRILRKNESAIFKIRNRDLNWIKGAVIR